VLEDVGDVLIAEGIVDGDGGHAVEACCYVRYGPLRAILGEDAENAQPPAFEF
jgi:hypothetical protein